MIEVWFLGWQEGKTASFRVYFSKLDAEAWARQNQSKIGTNWNLSKGEVHGDVPLFVCYDTNTDSNKHVIFTDKPSAEKWLQENDSGKMDVRKHKVGDVF